MTAPNHIALIGPMGSGKSTVGQCVAARLGWAAVDTDAEVEVRAGCPVRELFATRGEATFRALESEVLGAALSGHHRVIATGGGVVLDPANRARLAGGAHVVWLRTSIGAQLERLVADAQRPLLAGPDRRATLMHLAAARDPLYAGLADAIIDTDALDPQAVAERILASVPPSMQGSSA